MNPRGQFHIPAKILFNSFKKLLSKSFFTLTGVEKFNESPTNHLNSEQVELFSSCRVAFYSYLKIDIFTSSLVYNYFGV